ncbi:AEC family transporter [Domibacillus sp. DTU_2020_1001157_1_SI_ALB_TIR_016]|uniref:AEC family transporter n=1 Tax=Domibacillus sp. DTU_2020_1001157_1_SI_ALB_TIR_016 TaxID=3077789 RepID=UPI0028E32A2C|nr:AEC family transporter [Domibacillus sp. DTU_2020_1001157_1_SI_ALB_TIR_016]WNS80279.1 AEC family transporter [Domibacillus sp. DTU_2020_1001157_1_SI_ALB_TIR_016]
MLVFASVFLQIILPMFLLIAAGAVLHRKYTLHMPTLSKLTINFFLPMVCFVNIYETELSGKTAGIVFAYLLLFNGLLIMAALLISKLAGFDRKLSSSYQNSGVLSNSGNYGLPVSGLVFAANPLGLSVQIIISIFQNLLTYTWGFYNSVSASAQGEKVLKKVLKLPVLHALVAAVILKAAGVTVPSFLWSPIQNASNAFLAVALLTLGAQCAYMKITSLSKPLVLAVFTRLFLSPAIGLLVITILNVHGTLGQAMFIASSFPTSRNSALLALEYDNYPEFASQAVIVTTILSSVTVAVVIYLAKIWFPA